MKVWWRVVAMSVEDAITKDEDLLKEESPFLISSRKIPRLTFSRDMSTCDFETFVHTSAFQSLCSNR